MFRDVTLLKLQKQKSTDSYHMVFPKRLMLWTQIINVIINIIVKMVLQVSILI